jgi:DnaJ family protein A protein 5
MEKENKRLREEGIKEFNDAVRSLVSFVRKRDPRYAPNVQSEADRQKALRDAAAAQAARSRALHQAKLNEHVQPAWTQTHHTEEEGRFSESEQSEEEEFECVTCNKVFKSEKQYEAHERSKKHIKAVQQLIRQMRKENKLFELDHKFAEPALDSHTSSTENDIDGLPDATAEVGKDISVEDSRNNSTSTSTALSSNPEISPEDIISEKVGNTRSSSEIICEEEMPENSDDEYAPRDVVEERVFALGNSDRKLRTWHEPIQSNIHKLTANLDTISLPSDSDLDGAPPKKLGKAKAKRAKKAAREAIIGSEQTVSKNLSCNRSS